MQRSHKAGKPFFAYYPMALCHDVTDDLKDENVAYYKDGRWMTYAEMIDLLPTLAEVAGLKDDGVPRDGISFAPLLLGRPDQSRRRLWVYIEHRGNRCLRSPNWKLYGDGRFFDLNNDPEESQPLGKSDLTGEAGRNYAELSRGLTGLKGPLPGQK